MITVHPQPYSVEVYDEYVIPGNTAVFKCSIPSFVRDQVLVTQWMQDSSDLIPANSFNYGKFI